MRYRKRNRNSLHLHNPTRDFFFSPQLWAKYKLENKGKRNLQLKGKTTDNNSGNTYLNIKNGLKTKGSNVSEVRKFYPNLQYLYITF